MPLLDEQSVTLSSGDPWNDWKPQAGKVPSLSTLDYVRRWAKSRTRETPLGELSGDDLAAAVLAHTFPDWTGMEPISAEQIQRSADAMARGWAKHEISRQRDILP